jgi:NADH-quinone oxidoreductase subunit C
VPAGHLIGLLTELRDDASCRYEQLIDLCGVDYSTYGGQTAQHSACLRFAVVYHLLSVPHNQRLRVVANVPEEQPVVASVVNIWAAADWFEREAFDLFGILFEGHPDLRRILTDYGFIGHPFRKDFPLSGHVEMRFDEEKGRVVYEPVSIEPRVSVPRVIRRGLARD